MSILPTSILFFYTQHNALMYTEALIIEGYTKGALIHFFDRVRY